MSDDDKIALAIVVVIFLLMGLLFVVINYPNVVADILDKLSRAFRP